MKSRKMLFVGAAFAVAAVGVATVFGNNLVDSFSAGEREHAWQHYEGIDPTSSAEGFKEYWICCDCHEIVFEAPAEGAVEGHTTTEEILNEVAATHDDRYLAKAGKINVPTSSATNWEATSATNKVVFGQTIGSHQGTAAMFQNYQWPDWTKTEIASATYTLPGEAISAKKISFTYYTYNSPATVDVTISAINAAGTKIQLDKFTVAKGTNGWQNYTKDFDYETVSKLVIETQSREIGENYTNQIYVDDIKISAPTADKGNVTISTEAADKANWSHTSKNDLNKIAVGTGPWWGASEGSGSYLTLRAYQSTDWEPTAAGLTAIYTNPNEKTVNKLAFKYYLNSGSFVASKATLTFEIVSDGVATVIDTMEIVKDSAQFETVIDTSISFDELVFNELKITLATNEPKGTNGNTCVFMKEMAASYVG